MNLLQRISHFFRTPEPRHIWKETRRENLGSFVDYGDNPHDITTVYRIAVHETCVMTGATRVREIRDLFPVRET